MTDKTPKSDSGFPLIVAALLVIIIVALAGLWVMERGHRHRAETSLRDLRRQLAENQKKTQVVGQMLVRQVTESSVDRERLATRQVKWDGQDRTVLLLAGTVGEKIGFQPGDAILVTQPPTTQPTTQPETQSGEPSRRQ